MREVFEISDGFRLRKEGETWTDGDLEFDSGPDGLSVDFSGTPLDGKLITEENQS